MGERADQLTNLIAGDRATVALAAEEFLAIHRICDLADIPREHHGERLSAAQRVQMGLRGVRYRGPR